MAWIHYFFLFLEPTGSDWQAGFSFSAASSIVGIGLMQSS